MQPAIRERLEKCSNLPSLPAVALQVLKLCQGEDLDLGQIAKVITNDPALSAKMLRLVNSPSYGLRQQVKTISHALALLGVNAVRTLALSFSLASDLRRKTQPGLDLTIYWKRSALSAVAGRELAVGQQDGGRSRKRRSWRRCSRTSAAWRWRASPPTFMARCRSEPAAITWCWRCSSAASSAPTTPRSASG